MATREEKMWKHYLEGKRQAQASAPATSNKRSKTSKSDGGPVRHRNWADIYAADPDGYEDLDIQSRARVMPKGETEWRQAKVVRSPLHDGIGPDREVTQYTDTPGAQPEAPSPDLPLAQGTVIEIASDLCRVDPGDGAAVVLCTLRRALRIPHSGYGNMLAVGDAVTFSRSGNQHGIVEAILPRRSALARPDPANHHRQQVIVANVDQVLIVAAWREPAFWPELVDRYLIAALRFNLSPIVCINKVDLADEASDELSGTVAAYHAAGCRVICTSALLGIGLDELERLLQKKTTVLAGLSGVGKSSLLTAVEPELDLRVGEVSARRHEGRHTTTQVTIHPLAGGGFVADTPGIRDMGLAGLKPPELLAFYPEFAVAGPCAYANCLHLHEPGCAVRRAVRTGRLYAMRYESYLKIRRALAG